MRLKAAAGGGLILAALAATAATFLGGTTSRIRLNLGPGDTSFVTGFQSDSDVVDKVGWHWTSYSSAVKLPFTTRGSDLGLTLRYARVFNQEAVLTTRVGEVATEVFRAQGSDVRTTELHAAGVRGPITIVIEADSHERRNMGLRMDSILVDVRAGAPFRLEPAAGLRPLCAVAFLSLGLLALGAGPIAAGVLALGAALGLVIAARDDLFTAWRLTELVPLMIVIATAVLLGAKRLLIRMGLSAGVARCLTAASLATMVFRLALISHPDFYYPDLLTHTRVAQAIADQGPAFFLDPARSLGEQGAWTKPVLGGVSSLPYAVLFHVPYAVLASILDLNRDQIESAMKAGSALISVLPIPIVGLLASRLSLPPLAALGLCFIQTYTSRLAFALMPALFGHVFDLLAILAIARLAAMNGEGRPASMWGGWATAFLLAGHLSYTSSAVNEGLFMAVLVALFPFAGAEGRATARMLILAEAGAALTAFLLYYRHFVVDVVGLFGRLVGRSSNSAAVASVYPVESFWFVLFERTTSFFFPSILIAALGLVFSGRAIFTSKIVQAWGLTYLGLIFLRAKIPDVFRYGHETLFLTPLVAVLAATALIHVWRRGGISRTVAIFAGALLAVYALAEQQAAVFEQFKNAL